MRTTANRVRNLTQRIPSPFVNDEAYHLASLRHAPDMADVIWEVKRAFQRGVCPTRSQHGASLTYFLNNCEGEPIAVFKQENCYRELVAYRLDYHNFARVPQTVLTSLEHPLWGRAFGSCQIFVPQSVTGVELDQGCFRDLSATSVRRMASLDIRLLNEDRHTSNILVNKRNEIIPIDHGYTLPRELSGHRFMWLDWNQAFTSFTADEVGYISSLDPEKDRNRLIEEFQLEELRADRLFIATILLQQGVLKGLTPYEIGNFMIMKNCDKTYFEYLVQGIMTKKRSHWTLFSRSIYDKVKEALENYEKKAR